MVVLKHCLTSKFKLQQNETETEVSLTLRLLRFIIKFCLNAIGELQTAFLSSKSTQMLPEVFLANSCFLIRVDIKLSLSKSRISY